MIERCRLTYQNAGENGAKGHRTVVWFGSRGSDASDPGAFTRILVMSDSTVWRGLMGNRNLYALVSGSKFYPYDNFGYDNLASGDAETTEAAYEKYDSFIDETSRDVTLAFVNDASEKEPAQFSVKTYKVADGTYATKDMRLIVKMAFDAENNYATLTLRAQASSQKTDGTVRCVVYELAIAAKTQTWRGFTGSLARTYIENGSTTTDNAAVNATMNVTFWYPAHFVDEEGNDMATPTKPALSMPIYSLYSAEDKYKFTSDYKAYVQSRAEWQAQKHHNFGSGLEGVRQSLIQRLSVIRNELWYNYLYGLPLLSDEATKGMLDAAAIDIIYGHPAVYTIEEFTSSTDKATHSYYCSFRVRTRYGLVDVTV